MKSPSFSLSTGLLQLSLLDIVNTSSDAVSPLLLPCSHYLLFFFLLLLLAICFMNPPIRNQKYIHHRSVPHVEYLVWSCSVTVVAPVYYLGIVSATRGDVGGEVNPAV